MDEGKELSFEELKALLEADRPELPRYTMDDVLEGKQMAKEPFIDFVQRLNYNQVLQWLRALEKEEDGADKQRKCVEALGKYRDYFPNIILMLPAIRRKFNVR